ncbi:hypothetical protein BUALT_Bualt03G0150500 [Buddleja alternifolia]|uniref:Uncharacterized protein n=1 Tax=Buddleja alternifolia TaxID=168488 RepID=A0AAV6Y4R4_9LAMI|nr:hypothetical protein BUALT_Bualt03G0150500 [Buddleja alternifolia]
MFFLKLLAWIWLVGFASGAGVLPDDEVESLQVIARSLGKRDWNFSVDPCSGLSGWVTQNPVKGFENAVTCNCTFANNTVCHIVSIHAQGIDKATVVPNNSTDKGTRMYRVYAWVLPEFSERYFTQVVFGLPDPYWDWGCNIPVGTYEPYKYMHLEICRVRSKSDPGTSNGRILVGRTRIRLPKPGCRVSGGYELVVPNESGCIAEGHIVVAMKTLPVKPIYI